VTGFLYTRHTIIKTYQATMDNQNTTPTVEKTDKGKEWMKKHPIWTAVIAFILIGMVASAFSGSAPTESVSTNNNVQTATPPTSPQNFEDRIKALAIKTGATEVSFNGIDDQKADSDRPEGSRMITVKLNVTSFLSADSFYRNTGELSGKILQETFASNPNAYDVIVWYYGETTDQYGNKKNDVILSQAIDKDTYQKINWQNFDSSKLCDFLRSEGSKNEGQTTCVALANIK
jgi:hypothetical protein